MDLFDVEIVADEAKTFYRDGYEYVSLPNKSEYSIKLINHHNTVTDAIVSIDGVRVGSWKIYPRDSIVIERPSGTKRKFTFVKETGDIARNTGAVVGGEYNGLITVTFKPRLPVTPTFPKEVRSMPRETPLGSASYSSGVTVLGDYSDQNFIPTPALLDCEVDKRLMQTLSVRLVVEDYIPLATRKPYPPRLD